LPKTGELLAIRGSYVLAENHLIPIGTIFGFPQYEVLHEDTSRVILVNIHDIK
jgi:hypothetical protein